MSSIQQNSHSMLGINTLETDEITFGDGTTMSSTSDFASASDLSTVSAQATTNAASIAAKQDAITAGDGLAFNGSTLNAEYTASNNGGLSLTGTEFSLDFTNTNAAITIPQQLVLQTITEPQLLVETGASSGLDAVITIRGARNANTSSREAQLRFQNYDNDLTTSNYMGQISGFVTNSAQNYGGLVFDCFNDGQSRVGAMTMSSNGNFNIGNGTSFQDTYKFQVGGSVRLSESNYIKPQIQFLTYDKDNINSSNWGNGSIQNTVLANRTVGDSFCSVGAGTTTLTKNGYYRIRVSAQTQVKVYNDRLGFMNYLRIVSGGTTTNYDFSEYKNFFGWIYTRNNGDGAHGSVSFEDYIYLTSGSVISVRHKCETGGTISFTNALSNASLDNYLSLQIERIYDTNPEA